MSVCIEIARMASLFPVRLIAVRLMAALEEEVWGFGSELCDGSV